MPNDNPTTNYYLIARAEDAEALAEQVVGYLDEGWDLAGGVSIAAFVTGRNGDFTNRFAYAQAMVKRPRNQVTP